MNTISDSVVNTHICPNPSPLFQLHKEKKKLLVCHHSKSKNNLYMLTIRIELQCNLRKVSWNAEPCKDVRSRPEKLCCCQKWACKST